MKSIKGVNFQIDSELYKEVKLHVIQKDLTLKGYIISLIKKDLEKESEK